MEDEFRNSPNSPCRLSGASQPNCLNPPSPVKPRVLLSKRTWQPTNQNAHRFSGCARTNPSLSLYPKRPGTSRQTSFGSLPAARPAGPAAVPARGPGPAVTGERGMRSAEPPLPEPPGLRSPGPALPTPQGPRAAPQLCGHTAALRGRGREPRAPRPPRQRRGGRAPGAPAAQSRHREPEEEEEEGGGGRGRQGKKKPLPEFCSRSC